MGIDAEKERNSPVEPHIELVVLIDLQNNIWHWTGKSYPTSDQENGLVRIADLRTHFLDLPSIGKVMILVCHDLKVFDPRHYNRESLSAFRRDIINCFRCLARYQEPVVVLHHPHTTDCVRGIRKTDNRYRYIPGTWDSAWSKLTKWVPTITTYASAGRYYNSGNERSELNDVREGTKCGSTI